MIKALTHVSIYVKSQDDAKKFYVDTLGFKVVTDDSTTIPGYRWLSVAPKEQTGIEIVLVPPMDAAQQALVGKQGTWVLSSDDIQEDYRRLKERGVKTHSEPTTNPYGTDFVFEDDLGNTFDLVQAPR